MKKVMLAITLCMLLSSVVAAEQEGAQLVVQLMDAQCQYNYRYAFNTGSEAGWEQTAKITLMQTGLNEEGKQSMFSLFTDKELKLADGKGKKKNPFRPILDQCARYGAKDKHCGVRGGCKNKSLQQMATYFQKQIANIK